VTDFPPPPGFRLDESEPAFEAVTEPEANPRQMIRPGRRHLVVVITRPVQPGEKAGPTAVLVTRFWHPRDRRWSENFFESIDHAIRLFVDESGWVLLQQQALESSHEYELIFEARREDFARPSTEEMLEDVGLTPEDVKDLLDHQQP
jgi:hypothetical protein